MKATLKVNEKGFYRIVKTKEVIHHLNKMEKELNESLGETKGGKTYGALRTLWYSEFIDKEDILLRITWVRAQLCIIDIAELIEKSTYEGIKEQIEKIRKDISEMPI